ncbi:hypothetical protein E4O86_21980, partial [Rhizobiales bacterium L72]|nr:hypothetical protein [Propylenella binzhouense]
MVTRPARLFAATALLLAASGAAALASPEDLALAVTGGEQAVAPIPGGMALSREGQLVWSLLDARPEPRGRIERDVSAAVRGFYERRRYEPAWIDRRKPTAQAQALVSRMKKAAEDGLAPAAYAVPALDFFSLGDPQVAAEADVALSIAAARFIANLSAGRMDPAALGDNLGLRPERPDLAAALASLAAAPD